MTDEVANGREHAMKLVEQIKDLLCEWGEQSKQQTQGDPSMAPHYERTQQWLELIGLWPSPDRTLARYHLFQAIAEILVLLGDQELQSIQWIAASLVYRPSEST
jgi:hypothetical protein